MPAGRRGSQEGGPPGIARLGAPGLAMAIMSLREEPGLRVVVVDVPLAERLAAAHRVRVDCRTGEQSGWGRSGPPGRQSDRSV